MSAGEVKGTGSWTRLGIFLQVAAVVVLAAVAAGLSTWLSARPGLRARWDLTATGRNTLDPVLAELIEKLPEKASVEIFFRPVEKPLDAVGFQAQNEMRELLFVALNGFPHKLRVVDHDLGDVAQASERMRELHLEEVNVVVIESGGRRAVLRLFRDIARVDPGNPALRVPPKLESFRGEQAFGDALLRVSVERSPKVLFSSGHGERELYGTEPRQLGELHSALLADGFEVERWDSRDTPRLPEDCAVLAIIDPKQPFSDEEMAEVRSFVDDGGRLFVTPSTADAALDGPGSVAELLAGYGIRVQPGYAAVPITNSLGNLVDGTSRCAIIVAGPEHMDRRHPVTESLWRSQRRVQLAQSRTFLRGTAPPNGVLLDLLRTSAQSWRDLPGEPDVHDWKFQPEVEEYGPFILCMAAAFPPPSRADDVGPPAAGELEDASARILALGCPDALGNTQLAVNRDFALNAFNWLSQRDSRLVIRPRDRERRVLDVRNTNAMAIVNGAASFALPGLCLLLGAVLTWRRRS